MFFSQEVWLSIVLIFLAVYLTDHTVRHVDYKERLPEVQASTLLAVGRCDPLTPVVCSQELEAGISQARLVTFEHSGHAPFIEEPKKFVAEVTAFLGGE